MENMRLQSIDLLMKLAMLVTHQKLAFHLIANLVENQATQKLNSQKIQTKMAKFLMMKTKLVTKMLVKQQ